MLLRKTPPTPTCKTLCPPLAHPTNLNFDNPCTHTPVQRVVNQLWVVEQLAQGGDGGQHARRLLRRKQAAGGLGLEDVAVQGQLKGGHAAAHNLHHLQCLLCGAGAVCLRQVGVPWGLLSLGAGKLDREYSSLSSRRPANALCPAPPTRPPHPTLGGRCWESRVFVRRRIKSLTSPLSSAVRSWHSWAASSLASAGSRVAVMCYINKVNNWWRYSQCQLCSPAGEVPMHLHA